ncbi:MAG: ribonuclease P protein component [Patescibacteria group bacterium]
MLPKLNRVRKKKDFEVIFTKGKSFKNEFLILKFIKNNLPESRFGFVISKKVSQKAVMRNKVKRRLGEVARANIKNIKKGIDIVFIALPGIEKKNFLETKKQIENTLKKSGLI